MQVPDLTIGAPYSLNIRQKNGEAFESTPLVVLVAKNAGKYYSAEVETIPDSNKLLCTWSADVTSNMIQGPLMLEVWDVSVDDETGNVSFNTLLKRIEEYTRARTGAPSPGYAKGNA